MKARQDKNSIWICTNLKHICRYRINQHFVALKLDSISINKSISPEFVAVNVSQDLTLIKNMSTQVRGKNNGMFGTKNSKTNRLKKTIKYKANEQITKYSN